MSATLPISLAVILMGSALGASTLLAAPAIAAPLPILEKDLQFAGGWFFQSRHNNCTARRQLGKEADLILAFNNFEDGHIIVKSQNFPAIDEEGDEDEVLASHNRGFGYDYDSAPDGAPVAVFTDGSSAKAYPGTAMIVDDDGLIPFYAGLTSEGDGVTSYSFGALQAEFWPLLKAGKSADIFILGTRRFTVTLSDSSALWAEMEACIAQYPNG